MLELDFVNPLDTSPLTFSEQKLVYVYHIWLHILKLCFSKNLLRMYFTVYIIILSDLYTVSPATVSISFETLKFNINDTNMSS